MVKWNFFEETFLKENYLNLGNKEIAKELNRSVTSISAKIKEMNLSRGKEWNSIRMKLNNPSYNKDIVNKRVKTLKLKYLKEEHPNKGRKRPDLSKRNKENVKRGKDAPNWKGHSLLKKCKYCGRKFEVWKCVFNKIKFCGIDCYGKYLREYGHSEKVMEAIRKNRAKQIFPKKDSSIELKIQNFLKQLGIEFFTHKYMKIEHGYQCDILIPKQKGINQKIIIECDGDYWHGNKEIFNDERLSERIINQRGLDNKRTKELLKQGFKVLRLWENEIKVMKLNDFKNRLDSNSCE